MDWLQIIILALIQGITEFLPISSSAHLLLPSILLGWKDQGLAFDIAVHLGSLLALITYFRQQLLELLKGWVQSLLGSTTETGKLSWYLVLATIPAGIAGFLSEHLVAAHLRTVEVILVTTVAGALLLWVADRRLELAPKSLVQMTAVFALLIGAAQALAIIPGVSRSGITLTLALLLGFKRLDAARFSFLMAVPIIAATTFLQATKLEASAAVVSWSGLGLGILLSAASAFLCIRYFLKFIEKVSLLPFVLYRLLLAMLLIAVIIYE